ncbi:MAG: carbonic anhydrase [Planctomycetes bacterium]|nr:carbonic anhydrase [Planctomycetota bacterium]
MALPRSTAALKRSRDRRFGRHKRRTPRTRHTTQSVRSRPAGESPPANRSARRRHPAPPRNHRLNFKLSIFALAGLCALGAGPEQHGSAKPADKPAAPKVSEPGTRVPARAATTPPKEAAEPKTAREPAPAVPAPASAPAPSEEIDADKALALLKEGNQRWVDGKATAPNTETARREALADKGQKPFVTIVTCSDSRVPVERTMDRGLGDLFVVRVAGNRAGTDETGTVEYGVEHLKTPLLVVMGHTKCGAVAAAVSHAQLHGKVAELVKGIEPAVERARRNNPGADEKALGALAVKENVWQTIFDLYKSSDTLREAVEHGEVKVVGAIYDISSGKVEWLGEHPWQAELLHAMAPKADETAAAQPESP